MPPQIPNATKYAYFGSVYIGGPMRYVRDASLLAGIPAETTASATTGAIIDPGDAQITLAGAYTAFLTGRGAVRIEGDSGDNWFTYEAREDDTLLGVVKVAGDDATISAGATVSQWRDLTSYVTDVEMSEVLEEGELYWTATIKGHSWNSLVVFQDAAVLAIGRVWDDVLDAAGSEREDEILFQGYLDLPTVTADSEGNEWSATVTGRRRYLKLQQVTPGVRGGETIEATWTASDSLDDVTLEPTEGDSPSDFDIDNVADNDARTLYISKDVPGVEELIGGPVNAVTTGDIELRVTQSGQGLKITMVYPNPAVQSGGSQQQQQFIVVYNALHEEPPNRYPWVGQAQVTDAAGNVIQAGIPAGRLASDWGNIDLNGFQLETIGGTDLSAIAGARKKIYLGSKNGGPSPQLIIKPHTGAVLCYDEELFRRQRSVPDGWQVFEYKSCDGFIPGARPDIRHRGVGAGFSLDPDGDMLMLRAAPRWTDDRRFGAQVSSDGGSYIQLTDITASPEEESPVSASLASWPTSGYVRCDANNALVWYDGIDVAQSRLLNTTTRWNNQRESVGTAVTVSGSIVQYRDCAYTWDAVAWSQSDDTALRQQFIGKIPGDYPFQPLATEKTRNQNIANAIGERVWGVWTTASTNTPSAVPIVYGDSSLLDWKAQPGLGLTNPWVSVTDSAKVVEAPALRQAIRRAYVMGGGRFGEGADSGAWYYADSNTAADWATVENPRIGNVDTLTSTIVMRAELTEHRSAYVVLDEIAEIDDISGEPYYRLQVTEGEELEFPASATNASQYCLVALVAGESPQYLTYQSRGNGYFYGVQRVLGSGTSTIPPGTEIKARINTRANSNTRGGNSYVIKNMPSVMGLVYKRWSSLKGTRITAVGTTYLDVPAGAAGSFPASGTLIVTASPTYQGNAATNPPSYSVPYTSRTDSRFEGCTFPTGVTLQTNWAIGLSSGSLSMPADIEILASREDNPSDPSTFLGANPSWDVVYTGAHGSQRDATTSFGNRGARERFYPFGGSTSGNPFYQHVCVRVARMTDSGRVKANSLTNLRNPVRSSVPNAAPQGTPQPLPSDSGGIYIPPSGGFTEVGSGSGFVFGWNDGTAMWNALYSVGSVVHDLLLDAGVPSKLISTGTTAINADLIRSVKLSEGSVWEACRSLAIQHGYIIAERPDGRILFVRDPRAVGATYDVLPLIQVEDETVWGKPTLTERPRHAVSQIRLEATNPVGEEHYTIVVPPNASELGDVATISGRVTSSEYAAEKLARLLWRRANGGYALDVPMGPFALDISAADILRVNLVNKFDDGGRVPQGDYLVRSVRHRWTDDQLTSQIQIEEFVNP